MDVIVCVSVSHGCVCVFRVRTGVLKSGVVTASRCWPSVVWGSATWVGSTAKRSAGLGVIRRACTWTSSVSVLCVEKMLLPEGFFYIFSKKSRLSDWRSLKASVDGGHRQSPRWHVAESFWEETFVNFSSTLMALVHFVATRFRNRSSSYHDRFSFSIQQIQPFLSQTKFMIRADLMCVDWKSFPF